MAKAKLRTAQANAARKAKSVALQKDRQAKLARLNKLGLIDVDARKAAKSSRGGRLVKQFQGVLDGTDAAIKVDRRTKEGKAALARVKAAGGAVRGDRIIVPKASKGETLRFDKRTGEIVGKRYAYGNMILRRIVFQPVFDPAELPQVPKGEQRFYSFRQQKRNGTMGGTQRFESLDDYIKWMSEYKSATTGSDESKEKFKRYWTSHTVIEQVVGHTSKRTDVDDEAEGDDE